MKILLQQAIKNIKTIFYRNVIVQFRKRTRKPWIITREEAIEMNKYGYNVYVEPEEHLRVVVHTWEELYTKTEELAEDKTTPYVWSIRGDEIDLNSDEFKIWRENQVKTWRENQIKDKELNN